MSGNFYQDIEKRFQVFTDFAKRLRGDEKGEVQIFCDRLFQAFGHDGCHGAGAELEHRIKTEKGTKYVDLVWGDKVLIEMKKRGEDLIGY